VCLEAQALAKKQFSFKVFFTAQLGHGHCLATIAIILNILNIVMAYRPTVTVQSQICGALTVSSVISHYLAGE